MKKFYWFWEENSNTRTYPEENLCASWRQVFIGKIKTVMKTRYLFLQIICFNSISKTNNVERWQATDITNWRQVSTFSSLWGWRNYLTCTHTHTHTHSLTANTGRGLSLIFRILCELANSAKPFGKKKEKEPQGLVYTCYKLSSSMPHTLKPGCSHHQWKASAPTSPEKPRLKRSWSGERTVRNP